MKKSIIDRFWKKVAIIPFHECWEWTGFKRDTGYGHINIDGFMMRAHRFSWTINYGPIPEGLLVCHKCDNPGCVRPDHLFLGTIQDNMTDKKIKKRGWKKRLLSKENILEIKRLYYEENKSCHFIGKLFKYDGRNICQIIKGKMYRNIIDS